MKFVSWNVNGLNAFINNHDGGAVISDLNPDVMIFQETKCNDYWFIHHLSNFLKDYHLMHNGSDFKNGYAGVGMMIKKNVYKEVKSINCEELGDGYESGRIVDIEFPKFNLIGVYTLNSGGKNELRIDFDNKFNNYINNHKNPVIIMGDLNVVSGELDYYGNYQNSIDSYPGLMQFEIDGYNKLITDNDLYDTYRVLHPTKTDYSWFSYRFRAYEYGRGWRLDYALASKSLNNNVLDSVVRSDLRYSDHCPIELYFKYE